MIYTKTSLVSASMCDAKATLSPLAAFQLVEDAVTEFLGELHIDGVTAMREYGATWVFVKTVIRFYQRPSWPEGLKIRSFVSAHSSAKLFVDTEIISSADKTAVIHARLELCALDLSSGSIRKASSVGVEKDAPCETALPDLAFDRFPKVEAEVMETAVIRSTNLDYNFHTNNVEYVRFILNAYNAKHLAERDIGQIEIHYGCQTFEGDTIQIAKHTEGVKDYFRLQSNEKVAAECIIKWK